MLMQMQTKEKHRIGLSTMVQTPKTVLISTQCWLCWSERRLEKWWGMRDVPPGRLPCQPWENKPLPRGKSGLACRCATPIRHMAHKQSLIARPVEASRAITAVAAITTHEGLSHDLDVDDLIQCKKEAQRGSMS